MRRVATALLALLLLAVAPGAARAAETTLATVADDSPMSAAGGWVAWSEQDPATRAWHLVTWHQGIQATPAVPPRTVPFDVDLGRDERGRVVATYARCVQDPKPVEGSSSGLDTAFEARSCTARQLDLATGTESRLRLGRPVGAVDVAPSRSGRFVAVARRVAGERVFRVLRVDTRTRGATELPHGRMPSERVSATGEVDALDLSARAVGFVWRVSGAVFGTGPVWEARVERLDGTGSTVGGTGYISGACGGRLPVSPSVVGDALWFTEHRAACDVLTTTVVRIRPGADGRGDVRAGRARPAHQRGGHHDLRGARARLRAALRDRRRGGLPRPGEALRPRAQLAGGGPVRAPAHPPLLRRRVTAVSL